ncbi:MAG TPA: hypothetical protein ENJ95_06370 [Bacteroidetes bacterium]|nr:hypothetical protein [Bacteroidota bacterium]
MVFLKVNKQVLLFVFSFFFISLNTIVSAQENAVREHEKTDSVIVKNTRAIIKKIIDRKEEEALGLLQKGIIIDGDIPENNPLINAIYNSLPKLISALIEQGASVKAKDKDGVNPLMAAAIMADTNTVSLLMDKQADPFQTSAKGYNSFDYAIYSGNYDGLEYLLSEYLEKYKNIPPADREMIGQVILQKKMPPQAGKYKNEIVFLALASKDAGLFFELIDKYKTDIQKPLFTGLSMLDISIVNGAEDITKGLVERGFTLTKPNKLGKLPISYINAAKRQKLYLFLLKNMLAEKAVTKEGKNLLPLIDSPKPALNNIQKTSPGFQKLLMEYAIAKKNGHIIDQLLDGGLDVNGQTGAGVYYLCVAVQNGAIDIVKKLLDKGADIHLQSDNSYRTTAFMDAASLGDVAIGQLLLDRGARIDFGDINNDPALNYAVYYGHYDFVKFLLEHHADFTMKGQGGYTALMTAKAHDYKKVIQLLEDYGAKE